MRIGEDSLKVLGGSCWETRKILCLSELPSRGRGFGMMSHANPKRGSGSTGRSPCWSVAMAGPSRSGRGNFSLGFLCEAAETKMRLGLGAGGMIDRGEQTDDARFSILGWGQKRQSRRVPSLVRVPRLATNGEIIMIQKAAQRLQRPLTGCQSRSALTRGEEGNRMELTRDAPRCLNLCLGDVFAES